MGKVLIIKIMKITNYGYNISNKYTEIYLFIQILWNMINKQINKCIEYTVI